MRDIPWEQIKITLFQNKLKDIKKITQGMEEKYKLQLQNCRKETGNKGNHFRNENKIRTRVTK